MFRFRRKPLIPRGRDMAMRSLLEAITEYQRKRRYGRDNMDRFYWIVRYAKEAS